MSKDRRKNDVLIEEACENGELFQTDAEDFFFFTKGTLLWSRIKNVVIGRPGYDNYLVTQVFKSTTFVSFLDVTNAVIVAHQTDASGTKAGHRPNPDKMWNMKLIKSDWQKGRTEYSWWIMEQFPRDVYRIQERYALRDIPWDDRWSGEEWSIMKQFIPQDGSCLQFARSAVHGVLKEYCKELTVVVYDNRQMK